MKHDTPAPARWTAQLPDGRLERLDLGDGVRLCVGDSLRVGRSLYTVEVRRFSSDTGAWVVTLRPWDASPRVGRAAAGA